MMNYYFTILLCICMGACHHVPHSVKPKPVALQVDAPEDAPLAYKQGWKDGCDSGLAGFGNLAYKSFYRFSYDKELIKDPLYAKAWKDRYAHCRAMVNRTLADGMFFGNKSGSDAHGYAGPGIFQTGKQLRDTPEVNHGRFMPDWFYGMDLPGSGAFGWDANAKHGVGNFVYGRESGDIFSPFIGRNKEPFWSLLSQPTSNGLFHGRSDGDLFGAFMGM